MDFSRFDRRSYPTVDVARGYGEWAATYEQVVRDEMDLRLLARLTSVAWAEVERAADLACGTGRTGAWLRSRGVRRLDGIDLSPEMLEQAAARGIYRALHRGDLRRTPLDAGAYDLVAIGLADEHLPDLLPMYAEASRLLAPGGRLVVASYHPQFLMTVGMPTHYHRPDGTAVAIETHVHLLGDHVQAAGAASLGLVELHEGVIDDEYVAAKPKWARYRDVPVSYVSAWRREPTER